MALAKERFACASEACAAGDAQMQVAGAFSAVSSATEELVGQRAQSDLAVGRDQDLGGPCRGLGVNGVCDRLVHARDRGMESFASLPDRITN
jgi:hypothetical protein